jgi:hypothetical protein
MTLYTIASQVEMPLTDEYMNALVEVFKCVDNQHWWTVFMHMRPYLNLGDHELETEFARVSACVRSTQGEQDIDALERGASSYGAQQEEPSTAEMQSSIEAYMASQKNDALVEENELKIEPYDNMQSFAAY